jgi:protein-tyrosine phosphatase
MPFYYHEPIVDRDITTRKHMDAILHKMHSRISSGSSVLVHCKGGKGRTPLVFMAYLIKYRKATLHDIEAQIEGERDTILSSVQRQS